MNPLMSASRAARSQFPAWKAKCWKANIAYVKITIFGEDTASNLHAQLQTLMAQNPEGIILDLRNNGGGLVTAAVSVASEFMNEGAIVYEKYGDGSLVDYPAGNQRVGDRLPLVVLVNEGTASASEIVAGAIQDYGLGKLIGVTTYGKGSMQYWVPISDGGTVRVTVAKWLTPSKRTIDKIGLTPDMVVERTVEDMTANLDPQLDAAIQVLLNPIKVLFLHNMPRRSWYVPDSQYLIYMIPAFILMALTSWYVRATYCAQVTHPGAQPDDRLPGCTAFDRARRPVQCPDRRHGWQLDRSL